MGEVNHKMFDDYMTPPFFLFFLLLLPLNVTQLGPLLLLPQGWIK